MNQEGKKRVFKSLLGCNESSKLCNDYKKLQSFFYMGSKLFFAICKSLKMQQR